MNVGDIVVIRTGLNNLLKTTGNIQTISKNKKRVDVTLASGATTAFYRVDGKSPDPNMYVNNPGSGMFGSMLNDRFKVDEIRAINKG